MYNSLNNFSSSFFCISWLPLVNVDSEWAKLLCNDFSLSHFFKFPFKSYFNGVLVQSSFSMMNLLILFLELVELTRKRYKFLLASPLHLFALKPVIVNNVNSKIYVSSNFL
jgi:hypothetical protein